MMIKFTKDFKMIGVLIIGGGPIGLACGIEAARAGLDYLIIEKGCLVNSIYRYPLGMTFFSTSEKLEIGNVPFVSHNPKPLRSEALEYYRRVKQHWNLQIHLNEIVLEITKDKHAFHILTSKAAYLAGSVILATGFYDIPQLLNIPGEKLTKVHHYYKEPHPYSGSKVAVVGAANSAVDAALECYRKGAEVTMVIRESKISNRVKYWVKPDIENRIKEKSIVACFNSRLESIDETTITIATPEQKMCLENDFVLSMTGYLPNFDFLTKAGIKLSDDVNLTPHFNSATMETNVENLYLAGVVCGGKNTHLWFIENSRVHAKIILNDIQRKANINLNALR